MKLNVPIPVMNAALKCAGGVAPYNSLFFELGETHYRIISSCRTCLFFSELPFTKEDDPDCDFDKVSLGGVNNEKSYVSMKDFVEINFLDDFAKIEKDFFPLCFAMDKYPLAKYRRVFPQGDIQKGFPFLLSGVTDILYDVYECLKLDFNETVIYSFGDRKPILVKLDTKFPCFFIAMPATITASEDEEAVKTILETVQKDITKW